MFTCIISCELFTMWKKILNWISKDLKSQLSLLFIALVSICMQIGFFFSWLSFAIKFQQIMIFVIAIGSISPSVGILTRISLCNLVSLWYSGNRDVIIWCICKQLRVQPKILKGVMAFYFCVHMLSMMLWIVFLHV